MRPARLSEELDKALLCANLAGDQLVVRG